MTDTPKSRAMMKGWVFEVDEDGDFNAGRSNHEKAILLPTKAHCAVYDAPGNNPMMCASPPATSPHERVHGRRIMPVERRHPKRENLLATRLVFARIRASTVCVVVAASGIASLSFVGEQFSARTPSSKVSAQLNVRKIDRHNERFTVDAGVGLAREYAPYCRDFDAGHVDVAVDIMCARRASGDLDIVIVALQ